MKVVQLGMGGAGDAWSRAVLSPSEVELAGFVEVDDAIAARQAENTIWIERSSSPRWTELCKKSRRTPSSWLRRRSFIAITPSRR
jgi:hypothetical protein